MRTKRIHFKAIASRNEIGVLKKGHVETARFFPISYFFINYLKEENMFRIMAQYA